MTDNITQPGLDLRSRLLTRIAEQPGEVCTPSDFADLAGRDAVDKSLQRLASAGELRRIDRGLYDSPDVNDLTGRPTVPDYRAIIRAVARRNKARFVVDGMMAANDLGLTTAVPARINPCRGSLLIGPSLVAFPCAKPPSSRDRPAIDQRRCGLPATD